MEMMRNRFQKLTTFIRRWLTPAQAQAGFVEDGGRRSAVGGRTKCTVDPWNAFREIGDSTRVYACRDDESLYVYSGSTIGEWR